MRCKSLRHMSEEVEESGEHPLLERTSGPQNDLALSGPPPGDEPVRVIRPAHGNLVMLRTSVDDRVPLWRVGLKIDVWMLFSPLTIAAVIDGLLKFSCGHWFGSFYGSGG